MNILIEKHGTNNTVKFVLRYFLVYSSFHVQISLRIASRCQGFINRKIKWL